MSEPSGVLSHLTGTFVDGFPRYLLTLWEYIFKGPRRFFIKYEQDSQCYVAPWPFLLFNALVVAALIVIVPNASRGVSNWRWDWSSYWSVVPAGFVTDILVVLWGVLAAKLTRQQVTARAMWTAYAYSSAWVLFYLPAVASLDVHMSKSQYLGLLGLATVLQLCRIAYLIASFVRFNYLGGRQAVYFASLTATFAIISSVGVLLAFTRVSTVASNSSPEAPAIQRSIDHYPVPLCREAVVHGFLETEAEHTSVWFEWGETPDLGNATPVVSLTAPGPFNATLSRLHERRTYFYRTVMLNRFGKRYGKLISFNTPSCKATTTK
jgi:hypothetical protein